MESFSASVFLVKWSCVEIILSNCSFGKNWIASFWKSCQLNVTLHNFNVISSVLLSLTLFSFDQQCLITSVFLTRQFHFGPVFNVLLRFLISTVSAFPTHRGTCVSPCWLSWKSEGIVDDSGGLAPFCRHSSHVGMWNNRSTASGQPPGHNNQEKPA